MNDYKNDYKNDKNKVNKQFEFEQKNSTDKKIINQKINQDKEAIYNQESNLNENPLTNKAYSTSAQNVKTSNTSISNNFTQNSSTSNTFAQYKLNRNISFLNILTLNILSQSDSTQSGIFRPQIHFDKNQETAVNHEINNKPIILIDTLNQVIEVKKDKLNKANVLKDTINKIKQIKTIEQLQKEQTDSLKKQVKHYYYIGAYYSPTINNSISGSLINDSFNNIKTKNFFSQNYGAYVRYYDKKWSFRIGINVNNISNETIFSLNGQQQLDFNTNIELNEGISNSTIFNTFNQNEILILTQNEILILTQNIAFYEIPLEFSYNIWRRKTIDLDLLGSLSYTYVGNNNLVISSSNTRLELGKTENFLPIGIGLGSNIRYKINDQLNIGLTPLLKYYPTLNQTNFRPLSFGIQAGIEYKINIFRKED